MPFLLMSHSIAWGVERDPRQFVTEPSTESVTMSISGKPCWTYVPQSREGKPYFHPLTIPGTDVVLTAFRPPDHVWHLGLWFSWKFINGVNFWEPDTNGVTRVLSQTVFPAADKTFVTDVLLAYIAKGTETVREKRRVRVITQPSGNYTIEWDSTFTAQETEAVFSSTPVKKDLSGNWATGGYSGLLWRFTDSPAMSYALINEEHLADVKTCGKKSASLTILATAVASGAKAKIIFRDNPENPRYPTPWFVRHSTTAHKGRGYYLIGPSAVFHEPLKLVRGESARFRYTLTVERL